MSLHGSYYQEAAPSWRHARPDELAAWRRDRRRAKRQADRMLRALFAGVFLCGAAGGYLLAIGRPW